METTTISVGPWKVSAARAPRPGAPRLVLTAPWPLTLSSFERIWPLLTPHFDVTAVDLPGFGTSPMAPDRMRPRAMADALEQILAVVAPEGAHLVATDVGVPAGLALAAKRGGQLRSLTLSDGPGTAQPILQPGLRRMVDSGLFRWLYSLSPATFVRLAAKDGYQRMAPPSLDEAVAAHRRPGMLRQTLRYLASYPEELPAVEAAHGDVDVPTLLLWGERDVFVPPENADLIAANLADARVVRLPEAGHFSHDDDPEGFAEALRDFVKEVEGRTTHLRSAEVSRNEAP